MIINTHNKYTELTLTLHLHLYTRIHSTACANVVLFILYLYNALIFQLFNLKYAFMQFK